ncbi:MAG: hypothetical protein M3H12_10260, partial [Chromatiales bacterium]
MNRLHALTKKGLGVAGTTGSNRVWQCPIKIKALVKENRGSYDYRHNRIYNILICSWNDNSVVTLSYNVEWIFPFETVSRWSAKEKKRSKWSKRSTS